MVQGVCWWCVYVGVIIPLYVFGSHQHYLNMTDKAPSPLPSLFSLIRLKPHCQIPPTRVDFTPTPLPLPPGASIASTAPSIAPVYNHDRQHYTPAFTLPADQKYYAENRVFEREQFEDKLRKATSLHKAVNSAQEAECLHVAVPTTHYCQLCQDKFEDYHAHTNSHAHRLRMTNSEGALLLRQMCSQFQKQAQKHSQPPKTKGIRKERRREQKQLEKRARETSNPPSSENSTAQKQPTLLSISELGDTLA